MIVSSSINDSKHSIYTVSQSSFTIRLTLVSSSWTHWSSSLSIYTFTGISFIVFLWDVWCIQIYLSSGFSEWVKAEESMMLHVAVWKNKNPDIPAVIQTLWKWQNSVYTNCCWPHSRADLWLSALLDMVTWYQRPLWGRSLVPSALWVVCWSSPCRSPSSCPTSAESTTRASEPRREERKRWGLHIIHP